MDARLPLLVDVGMTASAGFGLEACQTLRNLLMGNGVGVVRPQSENDGRFHFGVIQVCETAQDDEPDQNFLEPPHRSLRSPSL